MKKILFLFLMLIALNINAQSYAFGFKTGLTIGKQKWNDNLNTYAPLYKYHGAFFIEQVPEDNKSALFAALGYHLKGSRNHIPRSSYLSPITGAAQVFNGYDQEYKFNNVSMMLGGKKKFDFGATAKWYYMFGVRGDYTVATNLDALDKNNPFAIYYPTKAFVNKFNYGATVGAGIEFPFSEKIGTLVEFTVSPDLSRQYYSPAIPNLRNPYTGESYTYPEQKINNIVVELSVGFRFLRKIEYVD